MYLNGMKDWKQISTLLDKINHLHLNLQATNGPVSRLERDLMLDYLKALYEALAELPLSRGETQTTHARITVAPKEAPVESTPLIEAKPIKQPEPPPPVAEAEKIEPPKAQPAPAIEPIQAAPVFDRAAEPVEMIAPTPKPTVPVAAQPVETAVPSVQMASAGAETKPAAQGMSGIFEVPKVNDLSDRLGDAPIFDLNKALGFNEKYLICNQLFGGDFTIFYQTMQQLNQFSQFSQAQQLLSPLAHKHNWVEEEKKEQAQAFIKLVRRRYKSANS